MSRKLVASGAAIAVGLGAVALATPANAEPNFLPNSTDIVGSGSDTTMLSMQAAADVYNDGKTEGRLVSWDAQVGDVPAMIIPRAGATEVKRPNGSGDGKKTLYGAGNNTAFDYARSSSSLNADETNAGLQQIPFAADILELFTASTTNAPAGLTGADLVAIYSGAKTDWSEFPGGKPGTITALIPQPGSGTRSFFEGELTKLNGGTKVVYGSTVKEAQEHDPAPIRNQPNVISPFSAGRARLANAEVPGGIKRNGDWSAQRAVYNVVRSLADTTKFAGIFGSDGFLCSPAARDAIAKGGLDQLATPANGGSCGQPTVAAVTNLKVSEAVKVAANTTTTLKAATAGANKVKLTATVKAGSDAVPTGQVQFRQGTKVVKTVSVARGTATTTLSKVTPGTKSYTARYVANEDYKGSTSRSASVKVYTTARMTVRQADTTLTRKQTPKATVTVKRTDNGKSATGKVRARVKKGSKGSYRYVGATRTLKSGKATVTIPRFTSKGTYYINYRYLGTSTVKATSKTVKVTVR
ncbi:Ig-like domain repeat protein [Kribbia dieselivorans]|uniref:Ig-like domain repeat protein n=1 Tax=Kribbia dieselivorans TaxID=331526 RepID=UPI000837E88A|nr:Ig-like domain repeat protein [Kribbia dieselivorans]